MKLGDLIRFGRRRRVGSSASGSTGAVDTRVGGVRFYLSYMAKDKPALAGMILVALFLVWALIEDIMQELAGYLNNPSFAWKLLPSNPNALYFQDKLLPPSLNDFPNYIMGTNYQGQSIFSQVLFAAPHDAVASILIVASAIVFGMLLGTTAGFLGGWTDEAIMRITDAFLSLPGLVLAITISVILGVSGTSGFLDVLLALSIIWWPTYARFFRAQALGIRNAPYVESARLSGSGRMRILFRHIIPNSIDPIVAYATLDFGTVILTYAALAFLGIGLDLNYPEWGAISSLGLGYFPVDWWWALMPGLVITVVVVAFTLVGDRLQDLVVGRMTY
jgi:peptide/nickel transport system permease protein